MSKLIVFSVTSVNYGFIKTVLICRQLNCPIFPILMKTGIVKCLNDTFPFSSLSLPMKILPIILLTSFLSTIFAEISRWALMII